MGDILTGLEYYAALDEPSGTTATDSSGHNRNGAWNLAPTAVTGKINGGQSRLVQTLVFPDLSMIITYGSDYSISLWLKSSSFLGTPIIYQNGGDVSVNWAGDGTVSVTSENDQWVSNAGALPVDGAFHLLQINFSSSIGTLEIWIDLSPVTNIGADDTTNEGMYTGTGLFDSSPGAISVDDVRVYSRLLASADRTDLFNYTYTPSSFKPEWARNCNQQVAV